jgi:two-component system, cell cycle sensor histidine kinase and response regulator CckA
MLILPTRLDERVRILDAIEHGAPVDHDETEWVGKNARRVDVSVGVSPMRSPSGMILGARTVVRDVSGKKWLQSQYRQAQTLEALGRLASGAAQDLNNLVTVISGFSELLLMQLPLLDARRALVEEIARAGERAMTLTWQRLVFSRQPVVSPREL